MGASRKASWVGGVLLLAGVSFFVAIVLLPGSPPAPDARGHGIPAASPPSPASPSSPTSLPTPASPTTSVGHSANDGHAAHGGDAAREVIAARAPRAAAETGHLPSEARFLIEIEGRKGMDFGAVSGILRGDRFGDLIDRMSAEASSSPLARDLTELYSRSAADADAATGHAVSHRIACGAGMCAVAVTAATAEAFDAWSRALSKHPEARMVATARHDRPLADGSVEYRLVFSNDVERNAIHVPPR